MSDSGHLLREGVYCFDKGIPHPDLGLSSRSTKTTRNLTNEHMSARPATKLTRANFCKMVVCLISLSSIAAMLACGSKSSGSGSTGPAAQIGQATGSGQSTSVGTAFPNPFSATVEDSKNNPVSGASVTFTAPTSGASGTFANGQTTETDSTNSNGVATSSTFTANSDVSQSAYTVTASVAGVSATLNYLLLNLPSATVTATQGNAQGTLTNTPFAKTLQVTIILQNQPQSGVMVTFTAPSSGASGTFATSPPSTAATATTDSNGIAAAPAFTANGTTGVYQVTAKASNSPTPVTFDLINVSSTSSPFAAGNYVFSLSGTDANDSFYSVAGVFAVDANGLISSGYQTFSDLTYTASYEPIANGGALVRTSDGNVRIILNTGNTHIGAGGSGEEMFDAAVVSGSKAFLTEFDNWATASGELDAQTLPGATNSPCTAPCSYAFLVSGRSPGAPPSSFSMGGIFAVASANSISGGIFDANNGNSGAAFQGVTIASSSSTNINPFGVLQFTLTLNALATDVVFDGYIVDSNHIRLVESGGTLDVVAGGVALGQTVTTLAGVCTSGSSYVLGLNGSDHNGRLQVAGLFTMPNANPGSTVEGAINYNDLTGSSTQQPLAITGGACTPDTVNLGRVSINSVTIANSAVSPNLQMYVTGDSDGDVLALTLDSTDTLSGHGFQQNGGSFTSGSFSGNYAIDATGVNKISSSLTSEDEFDAAGTIAANGSGGISASSSIDLNWIFNTGPTTALSVSSGSYTANSNGVCTGAFTGLDAASSSTSGAFSFYLVDTAGANGTATRVIAIETDTNQLSLDFFEQE